MTRQMDNETALTLLEHAIGHLQLSEDYWHPEHYVEVEHAIVTLYEAHKAIGPLGQLPSWDRRYVVA